MSVTRDRLLARLEDARRQVEIEIGRGEDRDKLIAMGFADGMAETLELLGIDVPRWIDRPS